MEEENIAAVVEHIEKEKSSFWVDHPRLYGVMKKAIAVAAYAALGMYAIGGCSGGGGGGGGASGPITGQQVNTPSQVAPGNTVTLDATADNADTIEHSLQGGTVIGPNGTVYTPVVGINLLSVVFTNTTDTTTVNYTLIGRSRAGTTDEQDSLNDFSSPPTMVGLEAWDNYWRTVFSGTAVAELDGIVASYSGDPDQVVSDWGANTSGLYVLIQVLNPSAIQNYNDNDGDGNPDYIGQWLLTAGTLTELDTVLNTTPDKAATITLLADFYLVAHGVTADTNPPPTSLPIINQVITPDVSALDVVNSNNVDSLYGINPTPADGVTITSFTTAIATVYVGVSATEITAGSGGETSAEIVNKAQANVEYHRLNN